MQRFSISISTMPEVSVFGLSKQVRMEEASQVCSALWEDFMPAALALCKGKPRETYGVSLDMDTAGSFVYWAAMCREDQDELPAGMATLTLPAGNYASCRLQGLAQITEAYTYLYSHWLPQSGYRYLVDSPCYERYPVTFQKTGELEIFMPLTS